MSSSVWSGLSDRRSHWLKQISSAVPSFNSSSSSSSSSLLAEQRFNPSLLSDEIRREIELELSPTYFPSVSSQPLSASDLDQIRSILLLDSVIQGRERYLTGLAQLVSRVLLVLDRNVKAAFHLVKLLSQKLRPLHAEPPVFPQFRTEICAFAATLASYDPPLATHFQSQSLDAVDLIDIFSVWALPLFSCGGFSAEFTERTIDLILSENSTGVLTSIIYGILKAHSKALLDKQADALFQLVTDLPAITAAKPAMINEIFQHAATFHKATEKSMTEQRKRQEWSALKQIPGRVSFNRLLGMQDEDEDMEAEEKTDEKNNENTPNVSATPNNEKPAMAAGSSGVIQRSPIVPAEAKLPTLNEKSAANAAKQAETKPTAPDSSAFSSPSNLSVAPSSGSSSVSPSPSSSAPVPSAGSSVPALADPRRLTDADSLRLTHNLVDSPLLQPSNTHLVPVSESESSESQLNSRPIKAVPPSGIIKYSELTEYQVFPCIYYESYLLKARKASKLFTRKAATGFFGHLHRRFFVLQGHFLTYFKSHLQKKPTRDESLDLRKCQIHAIDQHPYGPFAMQIDTPTEKPGYILFAPNDVNRTLWIQLLHTAAKSD